MNYSMLPNSSLYFLFLTGKTKPPLSKWSNLYTNIVVKNKKKTLYKYYRSQILNLYSKVYVFFGGIRDSNPRPCIYYVLSLPTELSSRRHSTVYVMYDNEF